MFSETTHEVRVTVSPTYLPDHSEPEEDHYVWAYRVCIENLGQQSVQLRARHWRITDARGQIREVHGEGVVGQQPLLEPGESFEYVSGTPLSTPSGIMAGNYHMETQQGKQLEVAIPAFSLDSPHQPISLN